MRKPCHGCPFLLVSKDISGTEARCTAKSEKGRMILWHYGLNVRDTWYTVHGELLLKAAPAWCPTQKKEANHD